MTLTMPTHQQTCNSQHYGCHTPAQSPSSLPCQKPTIYQVRLVFAKHVHAVRAGGGPPGTNHGTFKAKPSSHNVCVTL